MHKGVVFAALFVFSIGFASAGPLCDWFGWFCAPQNSPILVPNGSVEVTHLECRNMQCVQVSGKGQNLCSNHSQCYNAICQNSTCTQVPGNGTHLCSPIGSYCSANLTGGYESSSTTPSNGTNITHLACISNTCTLVMGNGTNQCSQVGAYCNGTTGNGTGQNLTAPNTTRPDLVIVSHTVFVNGTNGTNGTSYSVRITTNVKNIGQAIAGPSTTRVWVYGAMNISNNVATKALAPGASQDLVKTYSLTRGYWNVYSKADNGLVVSESNENNNERTTPFTV